MAQTTHRTPLLPTDIIKEVCDVIRPDSFVNIYTLQQLRLVNRAWGSFATPILFRNYDHFSLGNCVEDLETRIKTLASSALRHRVKGLAISRYVLVPRAIMQHWSASKEREYVEILQLLADRVRHQLGRLLNVLGEGFQFQSLRVGALKELRMYEDPSGSYGLFKCSYQKTLDSFIVLLSEIMRCKAFSQVPKLTGIFSRRDVELLLDMVPTDGALDTDIYDDISGPRSRPINIGVQSFLARLHILEIHSTPLDDVNLIGYAPALGNLISCSQTLRDLTLRYNKRDAFKLLYQHNDTTPAASVENLSIVGCYMAMGGAFWTTFERLPRLKSLRLERVDMDHLDTWYGFFEELADRCKGVVSIFFELLHYRAEDVEAIEVSAFKRDIFDASCQKSYKRPILTFFEDDISSFMLLRSTIEERRENLGLHRDLWLSEFCMREDVVRVL